MIDPHIHLRDWEDAYKETVRHGLSVAYRAGLDGVFEMPNTNPPLTTRDTIERRLELADRSISSLGISIFHGIFAGITANPRQIEHVVDVQSDLFPRVVGLKLFTCHSTGRMGIVDFDKQRTVYRVLCSLGYRGVLAVHAERESAIHKRPDGSQAWNPRDPYTHSRARPPEAESESVNDQIRIAAEEGFEGILHIAHLSVFEALTQLQPGYVKENFPELRCRLTCGITPHHALLTASNMKSPNGLLLKMNPPLRDRENQKKMFNSLLKDEIDWIESDHAPHTLNDKNSLHSSGVPVLPYYPHFIHLLKTKGMSQSGIDALTHDNIVETFGISIMNRHRMPDYDLTSEYEYDPFSIVK